MGYRKKGGIIIGKELASAMGVSFALLVLVTMGSSLGLADGGAVYEDSVGLEQAEQEEQGEMEPLNGYPFPFSLNQRVELANEEYYKLQGEIVLNDQGQPFFKVDLEEHPWLATERRMRSPYYPISSQGRFQGNMEIFEGKTVALVFQAEGIVQTRRNKDGDVQYRQVMLLKPYREPELVSGR